MRLAGELKQLMEVEGAINKRKKMKPLSFL